MKQKNRKGFTIVELVIVIAVIAILAAVLIPTFSSLIAKANLSNDQQVVRILNTTLAYGGATETPENMQDAVDILTTEGYNFKSMKPRSQGHAFVWERTKNQILLLNDEGTVIYPENADTTDVQMFVSDFNDLPAVVHTAVLNTNIIVTEEIDLTGKTVDINNYVLDISGAGKLLVAGVRNGYLTDTAMASLGDLADAGSTRQIALLGDSETGTTEEDISNAGSVDTVGETQVLTVEGKQITIRKSDGLLMQGSLVHNATDETPDEIVIKNCVIDGTGVFKINWYQKVSLENCVFRSTDNSAGSVIVWYNEEIEIKNCRFENAERCIQIAASTKTIKKVLIEDCFFAARANTGNKNIGIQFSFNLWGTQGDRAEVVIRNNVFNYCTAAFRFHDSFLKGELASETDLSWIQLSGNTYVERGCVNYYVIDEDADADTRAEIDRLAQTIEYR